MLSAVTQPLISPDGYWWWDGAAWRPVGVHSGSSPLAPVLPERTDGLAIASLIASLTFFVVPFSSVAAIVTGHLSRAKARREHRRPSGMALAGLVIGYLGLVLLLLPALLILREAANVSR